MLNSFTDHMLAGQKALQAGSSTDALQHFQRALDVKPDDLRASIGLGLSMSMDGNSKDAISLLTSLSGSHPKDAGLFEAIGVVYFQSAMFSDAERWFRKSIRVDGFRRSAACNLGMAQMELGLLKEATSTFNQCLRKEPDSVSAKYHLSLCHLMSGDFLAGWKGFELRNQVAGRAEPSVNGNIPRWKGEPLKDRSIILLSEQGLGDTIQFARYGLLVAEAGADVYIQCVESLKGLFETLPGNITAISMNEPVPNVDFQASLLDMPGLFSTDAENIPYGHAYLASLDEARQRWTGFVETHARDKSMRVGLVWAGNPDNKTDHKRSIPLELFKPLLDVPECTFFSLQVDAPLSDLDSLPADLQPVTMFPERMPFSEVAAAMAALDLVITVDTSLAHLAGALGVPVWTLISYVPDWRWMLGRDDTNWYQSMRLFRQFRIGDWSDCIRDVVDELNTRVNPAC